MLGVNRQQQLTDGGWWCTAGDGTRSRPLSPPPPPLLDGIVPHHLGTAEGCPHSSTKQWTYKSCHSMMPTIVNWSAVDHRPSEVDGELLAVDHRQVAIGRRSQSQTFLESEAEKKKKHGPSGNPLCTLAQFQSEK